MTTAERTAIYRRQNGQGLLTARQWRRVQHKHYRGLARQ
jgi:hypothetical protein